MAILTTVFGTSVRHSDTAHAIATALILAPAFTGSTLLVAIFIPRR